MFCFVCSFVVFVWFVWSFVCSLVFAVKLNITVVVGWHIIFVVISAFHMSWVVFILLILIVIIAEHLIKVNFLKIRER